MAVLWDFSSAAISYFLLEWDFSRSVCDNLEDLPRDA